MGAAASAQRYDGHQEVAAKLAAPGPCLLAFMSPHCGLCASLRPELDRIASSGSDRGDSSGSGSGEAPKSGLQVAVLNAQQDKLWAPEMLAYDVQTVPCFVLIEPGGKAVCKTPAPRSRQQMEAALAAMVQYAAGMEQRRR